MVPENSIRLDSRGEAESAHHPMRCLRSSTYLEPMSPPVQVAGAFRSAAMISTPRAQCVGHPGVNPGEPAEPNFPARSDRRTINVLPSTR